MYFDNTAAIITYDHQVLDETHPLQLQVLQLLGRSRRYLHLLTGPRQRHIAYANCGSKVLESSPSRTHRLPGLFRSAHAANQRLSAALMRPPSSVEYARRVTIGFSRLSKAPFGRQVQFGRPTGQAASLLAEATPLVTAFYRARGLLIVRGLDELAAKPSLLLEIALLFGRRLEGGATFQSAVHPDYPQILLISNTSRIRLQPPPRPEGFAQIASFPTTFPLRRGWHTDGSFRSPAPDVSLLYCVNVATEGQGRTIYADCAAAYKALDDTAKEQIAGLVGLHIVKGYGRTGDEIEIGSKAVAFATGPSPQGQPLVRLHPITGRSSLYLCDAIQMDFVAGPIATMSPGHDGAGAALLYRLLAHATQSQFLYLHEWQAGDLVIYDNRCLIHCATWFDAALYDRTLWRTTVTGHPGPE